MSHYLPLFFTDAGLGALASGRLHGRDAESAHGAGKGEEEREGER